MVTKLVFLSEKKNTHIFRYYLKLYFIAKKTYRKDNFKGKTETSYLLPNVPIIYIACLDTVCIQGLSPKIQVMKLLNHFKMRFWYSKMAKLSNFSPIQVMKGLKVIDYVQ